MRYSVLRACLAIACVLASAGGVFAQGATGEQVVKTVVPCRLIDTRVHAQRLAASTTATFDVYGANLSGQGGSATGCGVPGFSGSTATVQSVLISIIAVNPAGKGNMKAWATDQDEPGTSVINFTGATNVANQILVSVRQDTPGDDVSFKPSQATDLVADVVGYTVRASIPRVVDLAGNILGAYNAADKSVLIDLSGTPYRVAGVQRSLTGTCTPNACVYFSQPACLGTASLASTALPLQASDALVDDCVAVNNNLYCPIPGGISTPLLPLSSICCPPSNLGPPPICGAGAPPALGVPATATSFTNLGVTFPLHVAK